MPSHDWTDTNAEIRALRDKISERDKELMELRLKNAHLESRVAFLEGINIPQYSNPPDETI